MSQTLVAPAAAPARARDITVPILTALLVVACLGAGGAKRAGVPILTALLVVAFLETGGARRGGVPIMIQFFDQIGLGQWLRIVTGVIEVVGAATLLVPGYGFFGAVWLAANMTGAILAHLPALPSSPAPAILLLVASLAVARLC
ncbi:DoxX family protein [Methylobacterium sp. E-041]|uniref:DoxX family protein n=1 Tax=Methylobacterium sp. E-041 TaxID=2836573 RepID=UPI001FBA88FC|nr:DoxX family protein [Methylobacterium sp. E-041]MCJ2107736.1 DoxX family protein [Methylobacterium sp. E-041]